MIKAFDLFCGAGGLTYGLKQSGIKVVGGIDIDESCRYPYEHNCKAKFHQDNIKNISYSDISKYLGKAKYKILAGCAPCQPFSPLTSKQKTEHSDFNLINQFLRIILEGKPEVILMENVPKIIKKDIYKNFKKKLQNNGYYISDTIIECSKFGIPQKRRRLILIGSLLDNIELPSPNKKMPPVIRDIIGGLEPIKNGKSSKKDPLHKCRKLSDLNIKRIKASKPGGTWDDWDYELLPDCYKRKSGQTFKCVYGRMEWNKISPTLTTQFHNYGSGRYGHPKQNRAISLREGALIQTFPKNYQFLAPKDEINLQKIGKHIGNSVPPKLAKILGKTIIKHIKDHE